MGGSKVSASDFDSERRRLAYRRRNQGAPLAQLSGEELFQKPQLLCYEWQRPSRMERVVDAESTAEISRAILSKLGIESGETRPVPTDGHGRSDYRACPIVAELNDW